MKRLVNLGSVTSKRYKSEKNSFRNRKSTSLSCSLSESDRPNQRMCPMYSSIRTRGYPKYSTFCRFREGNLLNEVFQNSASMQFMHTLIHVFLSSLMKIGECKVTKTRRRKPHKNTVFSSAIQNHWSESSENSTGSFFHVTSSSCQVSSKLIQFPRRYMRKCLPRSLR